MTKSNQTRLLWLFGFASVGVGLAFLVRFFSIEKPMVSIKNPTLDARLSPNPSADTGTEEKALLNVQNQKVDLSLKSTEEFKRCFSSHTEIAPVLSTEVLNALIQANGLKLKKENTDWENFKLTLPNGQHRRVRIEWEKENEGTLKWYSQDDEGYPLEEPMPGEVKKIKSSKSKLEAILALGTVTAHQKQKTLTFQSGAFIELNYDQDKLVFLHFPAGPGFGCAIPKQNRDAKAESSLLECKCLAK